MKRSTRGLGVVLPLAMVAAVGLAGCQPTLGLRVTTTADGHDAAPGDGVCEMTAGAGDCSLRAAVEEANGSTLPVLVVLPGAFYDLGPAGPLVIDGPSDVTIQGDSGPDIRTTTTGADVFDVQTKLVLVGLGVSGPARDGVHVAAGATLDISVADVVGAARNGVLGDAGSSIVASRLTFSGNEGSAITTAGSLQLDRAYVTGSGRNSQAAISVAAGATIADTTITGNPAVGLFSAAGTTTVSRSTIDHNQSTWSCVNAGCVGLGTGPGGIFAKDGSLSLVDSTVTANTVLSPFDGTVTDGGMQVGFATCGAGACFFNFATVTIVASTVDQQAFVVFGQATVSGSAMGRCLLSGLAGTPGAASFVDGGGNVVPTGSTCTFPTQLQVPDLQLGPLADNGGATQTRLPLAGSPVLDHVPTGTAGLCDAANPTDQRGITRPQGPACDAGAVEGHS